MRSLSFTIASLMLVCGFYSKNAAAADAPPALPIVAHGSTMQTVGGNAVKAASGSPETLVELGLEERVRVEDFDNTGEFISASPDAQQRTRLRTKIWARWTPTSSIEFFIRVGNEFKKTSNPATAWNKTAPDEGFLDNLYVDFKKLPVRGLSLKIGRQDLTLGEGFLLTDYSTGDGSRSVYMNGFDLTYSFAQSRLHVLGIAAPEKDHYLPRMNDADRRMNETSNSMLGLYLETKRRALDFDTYWLYNSEIDDFRPANTAAFTPDRHLSTIGGRASRKFLQTLTGAGEFAYQFGHQHSNPSRALPAADIRAWGGYAYLRNDFGGSWKPYLQVAEYVYSGDDYDTDARAEGFDPLFGRWPARSELLSYGLQKEKGYAYFSNMRITQLQLGFSPFKRLKSTVGYQGVDAFNTYKVGSPNVFCRGTHRGNLLSAKAELALNDRWKGHIYYEWMLPGNFYRGDDHAHFFRVEAMYTFKKSIARK